MTVQIAELTPRRVVVLNASEEALHTVSIKHAMTMLARGVAEVFEAVEGASFGPYPYPRVLKLVRYVYVKWRGARGPKWSKRGVHVRDGYRCVYCGAPSTTVDHVHPVSRGGLSTWGNTVAACMRCNQIKGDRTLDELGWKLGFTPATPRFATLHTV